MLDHVSLGVSNLERSRQFYDAILHPLGIVRTVDFGDGRGADYGAMAGQLGVEFTITREPGVAPSLGMHLCFRTPDRAAVQAFHAVALATGGRDDGTPGLRHLYHPDYFAAYVLDPDGHRIEVVCHTPELPRTGMIIATRRVIRHPALQAPAQATIRAGHRRGIAEKIVPEGSILFAVPDLPQRLLGCIPERERVVAAHRERGNAAG